MAHAVHGGRVALIRASTNPYVNISTTDNHGRVRAAVDVFVHDTEGDTHNIAGGDVIQFGGPDIPTGSRILSGTVHVDNMQVAGTSTVEIFIDSQENMLAAVDPGLIQMSADGNTAMNVRLHGEHRILPVVGATGSVDVPVLPYYGCVYAIVAATGDGWDIDGAAMSVTVEYVLD